jgi:hypothetical protein
MDSLIMLPTVRNPEFVDLYLKNAESHNFNLSNTEFMVLTEDFVDKSQYQNIFNSHGIEAKVLNQEDRDKEMAALGLSKYTDIIPKRSRAEETFGLLYMWMNGHKFGFTIDDDTIPVPENDFFGGHISNLNFRGEINEFKSNKGFVNVLNHSFDRYHLYPRGYPYGVMDEKLTSKKVTVDSVGMSQGLWTNVPDLDSVRILFDGDLNGQSKTRFTPTDYDDNFTVAKGNYLTVCSMNLAFRREVVPGFYQFKMSDNPWKIDRFDDIWSGVVAKKLMDDLGYKIINGFPLCQHNKVPRSTFKDLMSEAPGLEANETFHKIVASADTSSKDVFEKVDSIANALKKSTHPFVSYCGGHLSLWIEMLRKVS